MLHIQVHHITHVRQCPSPIQLNKFYFIDLQFRPLQFLYILRSMCDRVMITLCTFATLRLLGQVLIILLGSL